MNFSKKKVAAYLWSIGSLLFFVSILLFVFVYQPSSGTDADKTSQILSEWVLVATIWRVEAIAAVLIAVSSWYFATVKQSISWFLISFAHIVMILMYANMLGSYPVAAEFYNESPRLFPMLNDKAIWIFGFSNLLFLTGLAGVYLTNKTLPKWMVWTGVIISFLGALASLALYFELITFADLNIGGPLILILFLLNFYLGLKLAKE
ncbi:MAG: hypothetical protein HUJ22_05750 [Gracilimonas sp.]|uniref:hypothetical protein n=1 Tax=Gracilimonas sp. TaxID=1974203 RepID=UPI0019BABA89|nr:hypothetical protein [Gracilimonas sp.]MBD3616059.1 hypothetical protein [Gracilimonas sp.]